MATGRRKPSGPPKRGAGAGSARPGPGRKGPSNQGPGKKGPSKKASGKKGPTKRKGFQKKAVKVTPLADAPIAKDGRVRLNRFLASAGICSRRAADLLIEGGRVSIDGETVTELGTKVDPKAQEIRVDDSRVEMERPVYVVFNKPKGVVCTNARNEQRRRVVDFLPRVKGRIYTVGRLDADSEGLILLTNDGDFAQAVAHPKHGVSKTYALLVRGTVSAEDAMKARGGVWLSEGRTSGARVLIERRGRDRTYMKVILQGGRNRELRRVFAKLGYPVISLKRIRIGNINLHGLGIGKSRFLRPDEVKELLHVSSTVDGEA